MLKYSFLFFMFVISGCDNDVMRTAKNGNVVIVDMNKVFINSKPGKNTLKHINTIESYVNENADLTEKYYGPAGVKPSIKIYTNSMNVLNSYLNSERNAAMTVFSSALSQSAGEWIKQHPGSIVIPAGTTTSFDASRDVSEEIIAYMDKKELSFNDAKK